MEVDRSRRVVLLGSGRSYRNPPFVDAAKRLGLDVVTGEDVPLPLLSRARADLPLDYRDVRRSAEAIVAYARDRPVDAVLGVDDSGVTIAAEASAALGLPHNPPEAARRSRDKHVMRLAFAAAGVPSPGCRLFHTDDDPRAIAEAVRYPCVVKPTVLSGSRGVMRADTPDELVSRVERLNAILRAERCDEILVEDYVPGIEVALEGLLEDGRLRVLALFDKPDPLEGPFFEETLYVTPSRLPDDVRQAIADTAARAARALGLVLGPVHAELRVNDRGPWVVEVAGRSIGGLCSRVLRFGSAVSLEELILRQAVGLSTDLPPEPGARGVLMIPIPARGHLRAVFGVEDARAVPGIEDVEITARLNHPIVPLPEGDSYLGFVFARGAEPAAVERSLREAHARLRFDIVPALDVVDLTRTGGGGSSRP